MARKTARPGRTLAVFFVVLAIVYGLVALGGTWKPELGLDLQGGTRIMMIAKGHPSSDAINEARNIIDQRVNGSGVTAAKVSTQGSNVIVVEIPGQSRDDLVDEVSQTAQLRFRLVACAGTCSSTSTTTTSSASADASVPAITVAPSSLPSDLQSDLGVENSAGADNRALLGFDKKASAKKKTKKPAASSSPSPTATASPSADPSASASPTADPAANDKTTPVSPDPAVCDKNDQSPDPSSQWCVQQAVNFMNNPPADWVKKFEDTTTCPTAADASNQDDPSQPLIACDSSGTQKYLLTPAIIEGTEISDASYGIPQGQLSYVVSLDFHSRGRAAFADATGAIAPDSTGKLFAIVLDGQVISAATASSRINGSAQISGSFDQQSAQALANNLKYGALPVQFDKENGISHSTIGPSLAGNQLSAGLWAGGIGLVLVMLYCLFYYRGLGLVVISSLIVAGATIFGLVLLLSKQADFTLDLPGIAGLIVAVGITADSFIVYFERIRDEMRDGKSMRVAVESGWKRARNTCLAADTVSLLAALALYIFAAGDVRGFAFALGLSTLVDLVIFFYFTHPTIQWLSTFRFFNRGHKLSGLDPEALGVDRIAMGGTTGGAA